MLKGLKSFWENTNLISFSGKGGLLPSNSKSRPSRGEHSFFMDIEGWSLPHRGSTTELLL